MDPPTCCLGTLQATWDLPRHGATRDQGMPDRGSSKVRSVRLGP